MNEKQSQEESGKDAFMQWTQSMNEMWGGVMRLWFPDGSRAAAEKSGESADADQGAAERIRDSVAAALQNWQTFSGALSEPGSLDAFFKGVGAMPEVLAQLAQTSLNGFMDTQQKNPGSCQSNG